MNLGRCTLAASSLAWLAATASFAHEGGSSQSAPPLRPDWTAIDTIDQWQVKRRAIIAGMESVMGRLPAPEHPLALDTRILEEREDHGIVRRKLAYCTDRVDAKVTAWLLLPSTGAAQRRPAVLCLHQTTPRGKDSPAGLADRPSMHYALELARRGCVTLAPDYPSFGEYRHDFDGDDYESGSMKAVYDNMRSIDLLVSLPDVDPQRIGCIGHSLGGHNGLFTAVFDERIKAVATCCGFTRFHNYMGGDLRGWSSPVYMPRIASNFGCSPDRMPFDFPEVIAALAPRAVFIVAPTNDDNFAVEGVRETVAAARPIYELFGRGAPLRAIYPDGGHDFPDAARQAAYEFFDESFGRPKQ